MKALIPGRFYRVETEKRHTAPSRGSGGLFTGRRVVPTKQSDHTKVIRLTRDVDINKDGRIDNRDLHDGQIIGRTTGAKPDRVVIDRHTRNGRLVNTHIRKI